PTDRNGDGDGYRMLAEGLARAGVASIRYDKRGIGASDAIVEATLTIDDFVADAAALAASPRRDARFSKLTGIGHSEGGAAATLIAQSAPPAALVLRAAAGRPLGEVVHDQLGARVHGPALAGVDEILAALRDGKPVKEYPADLAALFRPSVEKLHRSEMALDPAPLLGKLKVPVAIVQGESDLQVSVADARRLAAARKDARLSLLPRVNHVLKEEAERVATGARYGVATGPLGPGVLDAVLAGVAR